MAYARVVNLLIISGIGYVCFHLLSRCCFSQPSVVSWCWWNAEAHAGAGSSASPVLTRRRHALLTDLWGAIRNLSNIPEFVL